MGFPSKLIFLMGIVLIPCILSKTVNKTTTFATEVVPAVLSTTDSTSVSEPSVIRSGLRSSRFGLGSSESKQKSDIKEPSASKSVSEAKSPKDTLKGSVSQSAPKRSEAECEVVFRDLMVPTPGSATKKSKVRLACTICYRGGYQEECAFVSKDSGHKGGRDDKGEQPFEKRGQESREAAASSHDDSGEDDDDESTSPVFQESKDYEKFVPSYLREPVKTEDYLPIQGSASDSSKASTKDEDYYPLYSGSSDSSKGTDIDHYLPIYGSASDSTKDTSKGDDYYPLYGSSSDSSKGSSTKEDDYYPVYGSASDSSKGSSKGDDYYPHGSSSDSKKAPSPYDDSYYSKGSPEYFEGHESRDDSREKNNNNKKDGSLDFSPIHIIPLEYMDTEYDPKFYESHDEAANVFHSVDPFKDSKSPYDKKSSHSDEVSRESKHSVRTAIPGMDRLRSYLPDVEPINPDKDIEPRKRSKTIEFTEQISFSSDEDDDKGKRKGSRKAQSSDSQPRYEFSQEQQGDHSSPPQQKDQGPGQSYQYTPPIPMPKGEDTKNCKVSYREAPSGKGKKMKCLMCGGKDHKGFSEECSVEYEEPTKHHEVYYGKQNYNDDPKAARELVYGNSKNAPYLTQIYGQQSQNQQGIPVYYIPYVGYRVGDQNEKGDKKAASSIDAKIRSGKDLPDLPIGYYTNPNHNPH